MSRALLRQLTIVLSMVIANSALAEGTPDFYLCANREGGEWEFGRAPYVCDVEPWGEDSYVAAYFSTVVFDDHVDRTPERARYVQEVHALLRDASAYYIRRRKPDVSAAEIAAWQRANFAKAHQETYWSHYRKGSDNRTKMVRGDNGHGHGLVQIDDRWHFAELEEGKGWHITENIRYGMELFFDAWQTAASASCVSGATDWRSRARSAYAAYNGGPTKICRWTDANDTWAHNDIGYRDKYDDREWEALIADPEHPTTINVPCFMEGNRECAAIDDVDADDSANWPGRQVVLPSGEFCVFVQGALECVDSRETFLCLNIAYGETTGSVAPSEAAVAGVAMQVHGKHECFAGAVDGLIAIGATLVANMRINVRAIPGGAALGAVTEQGKAYQVLDYAVTTAVDQDRYYRVREGGEEGYIYAGSAATHLEWASPASDPALPIAEVVIPRVGDQIRITRTPGINLRDEPAGDLLLTLASETRHVVEEVVVRGEENHVYYRVTDDDTTGYIYGGRLLDHSTLDDWAVLVGSTVSTYPETGSIIEIVNAPGINLRDAPGGDRLVTVPPGTLVYAHDILVQGSDENLYYDVTYGGARGFIFAGQLRETYTVENWVRDSGIRLANGGATIRINAPTGINLRQSPGGDFLVTVPAGTEHAVLGRVVQGDNNYAYYQLTYGGATGWVYAGQITGTNTLDYWVTVLQP